MLIKKKRPIWIAQYGYQLDVMLIASRQWLREFQRAVAREFSYDYFGESCNYGPQFVWHEGCYTRPLVRVECAHLDDGECAAGGTDGTGPSRWLSGLDRQAPGLVR